VDNFGLPAAAMGTSAVVFHATVDESPRAVRCFIRNDVSSRDRYGALGEYLTRHNLAPYVSATTWADAAIRVNGASWPVLQMEWIDGRALDQYVGFLVSHSDTIALATLADRWRRLIATLQEAEFAHGDLQHGNVLIDQQGQLRLVDFDGVWIPELAGKPAPTESGHHNYQHAVHHGPAAWGRWLDTFSALVIYLSLAALAKDPGLWAPLYNSTNLLFQKADFVPPFRTGAWKHLAALGDREVDYLAKRLVECCDPAWTAGRSLEMTIDRPWWERSGVWQLSTLPGTETGTASATASGQPAPPPMPKPPGWSYEASRETQPINAVGHILPGSPPSGTGPLTGQTAREAAGPTQWWEQRGQQPRSPAQGHAPRTPRRKNKARWIVAGFLIMVVLIAMVATLSRHG